MEKKKCFIRIAAIGDPHLTNSLPYTSVGSDYRKYQLMEFLGSSFQKIVKKSVDLIVVPGDLCHTTLLDSDTLFLLIHFLELCRVNRIPTVIVSGNHDIDHKTSILDFLTIYRKQCRNIYFKQGDLGIYLFKETDTPIRVVAISHCSDEKFLLLMRNNGAPVDRIYYNILVGHAGIKGTLHGSTKSIRGIKPENLEGIADGYDLMIFGHHHYFQRIIPNAFYSGSIQQTRMDERNTHPGIAFFDLPALKVSRLSNKYSPRFVVIDDYSVDREIIRNNIVKLVLDLDKKTEEENIDFIKRVSECEPYYLIMPRTKKIHKLSSAGKERTMLAKSSKEKVLYTVVKGLAEQSARIPKFEEHVMSLYKRMKEGEIR